MMQADPPYSGPDGPDVKPSEQDKPDSVTTFFPQQDRQELKQSQDLLQAVFDTSLVGMALHQAVRDEKGIILDFRIMLVNRQLERVTGRTDLVGTLYSEEFPGIKLTGLYALMLKVMESGQPGQMEYSYAHDGFDNWFSSMFVKVEDGLVATNIDITDRKRAEQEKLDLLASQNQQTFWATMDAQETERKRIAENLHNGLGQLLYGIKLSLEQMSLDASPINLEKLKKIKQTTDLLLIEAIAETRRLSHELTPMILEDFGLKEALSDVCEQLGRSHSLKIDCHFNGFFQRLARPIATAIYRTVQELVMNVVRHAGASKATVEVEVTGKVVIISVTDNGKGFGEDYKSNGIGLKTIRNKVRLLGGKFTLTSGKDKGSTISIRIPYGKA
ncbi:MAG: PAS domain-containing sensor histidine kinase [Hymenobacter sp.]|nr:MAG: PAS domain-containing sensor histidine kinase [Hymenobacter sp.]